jgi:hypothetical protein
MKKTTSIKAIGWLFVILGALVVVFSDQIITHWPVTFFYPDERSWTWVAHWHAAISMTGVMTCSLGTWLLSASPCFQRAYCIAFAASPIFVWAFIWWMLGNWGVYVTHGTVDSWRAQDCFAVVFLILTVFTPPQERGEIFGIMALIYLILCLLLLAVSLCSQNENLFKHRVSQADTTPTEGSNAVYFTFNSRWMPNFSMHLRS